MWYVVAVFLCNLISVLATGKLNYCGSKMCGHTNAHTFCQFHGGPGFQCIGYMEAPLSEEEKLRVITRLNQRRAAAASGRLKRFPAAGNMLKLQWIDELAHEAQLWANQCEPPKTPEENDVCRDLYSVAVGQCVASVVGEAPGLKPESMVDIWYMQNMFYKENITFYTPPPKDQYSFYGDFAQLVYAKSYMVGCGRSRFMASVSGRLRSVERLVCNVAPRGPAAGRALWTAAAPATACPPRARPDDDMPALCAFQHELDESNDQDNAMSLEEHILLDTIAAVERNGTLKDVGNIDEIFLTKVAVATMGDMATTVADFSGVQKRDVFEYADADRLITVNTDNVAQNEHLDNNTDTITLSSDATMAKAKSKVKLIGRPKSYNLEELNEVNVHLIADNDMQMQDLPVKENEFDVDYEFVESTDEITTTSMTTIETTVIAKETTIIATTIDENKSSTSSEASSSISPTTEESTSIETTPTINTNGITRKNIITELSNRLDNRNVLKTNDTDALLDEYLSDPETVRRLQEELDRMEQEMSSSSQPSTIYLDVTERSEKVRRALKEDGVDSLPNLQESPNNTTVSMPELVEMFANNENKTSVVNMVMRYMPYLKDYKNGLMKTAVKDTHRIVVFYSYLVVSVMITFVL